jgi:ATP-dependent DNA helicase PIF1
MDEDQTRALNLVLAGHNLFLTGVAGTGKSHVLKNMIDEIKTKFTEKTLYITSSTGVSAIKIGGSTLFGLFGFSPKNLLAPPKRTNRWQGNIILIIEEVSMISNQLFEYVDSQARLSRNTENPMGGVQVILVGDFLQLPPVTKGQKEPEYCFQSPLWRKLNLKVVELTHVYRQENQSFVAMLNRIRKGVPSMNDNVALTTTFEKKKRKGDIEASILFCHKEKVEKQNAAELEKLSGIKYTYNAHVTVKKGQLSQKEKEKLLNGKDIPVENPMHLKVGAQVSLAINYLSIKLCNGSRGVVIDFEDNFPVVQFAEKTVKIRPHKWEVIIGPNTVANLIAIPLKLAWAMTIHTCQGASIDYLHVNLDRAFAYGQVYVALSRATSSDGLSVENYNPRNVKVCPSALKFYEDYVTPESQKTAKELSDSEEDDEEAQAAEDDEEEEEAQAAEDDEDDQPQPRKRRLVLQEEDEEDEDEDEEEFMPKNKFIDDYCGVDD